MAEREQLLGDFVAWSRKHITGDEKGQAQIFLDRLFRAFGHAGSLDVGGSPEMRIRRAKEDGGGTSVADFVWKPLVLIETRCRFDAFQLCQRSAGPHAFRPARRHSMHHSGPFRNRLAG